MSSRAGLREVLATAPHTGGRVVTCFRSVSEQLTPAELGKAATLNTNVHSVQSGIHGIRGEVGQAVLPLFSPLLFSSSNFPLEAPPSTVATRRRQTRNPTDPRPE